MAAIIERGAAAAVPGESHASIALLWLAYVVFVVYGSLVPLEYRAMPLEAAWRAFANIQMLELGIDSRADWVANGVLFVPVGFLTVSMLSGRGVGFGRLMAGFIAAVFALALALAVEFAQLFFPLRTVSLNDLLAEVIGGALGILLAALWAGWFRSLLGNVLGRTEALKSHLLEAYAAAFLVLSLFPYDFLVSWREVEQKYASNMIGWLFAGALTEESRGLAVLVRLLAEVAAAIPLGILIARRRRSARACPVGRMIVYGALLGALIEFGQFFVNSGFSQGISVLTRAAAFGCAAVAWNARRRLTLAGLAAMLRRSTIAIVPAYLLSLAAVSGLTHGEWQVSNLPKALAEMRFMPFYYHYFTTEAKAFNSLLGVFAAYLPVGVLCWAWGGRARTALLLGCALAFGIETCKTFVTVTHADPSNVWIAAAAAWVAAQIMARIGGASRVDAASPAADRAGALTSRTLGSAPGDGRGPAPVSSDLTDFAALPLATKAAMAIGLAGVLAWLADFPTQPWLLALAYALSAGAIWRRPAWLLAIAPAALPMLDLAHWSGRFYLDEFDVLLGIGLTVGFARLPALRGRRHDRALAGAVFAVAIAYAIGTARGLWPPHWPDANAFNNYFSQYDALRIAKGALWAGLLWRLWRRLCAHGPAPVTFLAGGLAAGLAWAAATIVLERLAFTRMLDFSTDYRVTGPFSQMHTGGAYVECFLTVATPFLLLLLLRTRSLALRVAGVACLAAVVYALMVTYSRGGYGAFGVVVCVSLAGLLLGPGRLRNTLPAALLLGATVAAIGLPILFAPFAQQRLAGIAADLKVREAHWDDTLELMSPGLSTALLGMGLGRFPETIYWKSAAASRTANYQLEREGDNTFLRVAAGRPIYIDQLVDVDARSSHQFSARLRMPAAGVSLTVFMCRKWLYASADCVAREVKGSGAPNTWVPVQASFAPDPGLRAWPVKFSIASPSGPSAVDIDDLVLRDGGGRSLLANGDFSHRLDHWYFGNDEHLAWHVKNMALGLFFDLGAVGLGAVLWLTLLGLWRSGVAVARGDAFAGALFAALSGFLIIGTIDSLVDTPRFLFLFLLLALLACESRPRNPV